MTSSLLSEGSFGTELTPAKSRSTSWCCDVGGCDVIVRARGFVECARKNWEADGTGAGAADPGFFCIFSFSSKTRFKEL